MAIVTIQQQTLGQLGVARGGLGPRFSGATRAHMEAAIEVVGSPASYSSRLKNCVICIEDRLYADGYRMHAPRLAGGALNLALMHNFQHGGLWLSDNVRALRSSGHYLVSHEDCGALALAEMIVTTHLVNAHASGYELLDSLRVPTPMTLRLQVAEWARRMPRGYFDVLQARRLMHVIEPIVGQHNAVSLAVSRREGMSFVSGLDLYRKTDGLMSFAFDPWVARRKSREIGVTPGSRAVMTLLGQVFTAEALLELGGADLLIAVCD